MEMRLVLNDELILYRGVYLPFFLKFFLGIGTLFCKMKLNTMQNFWQKGSYSPFWIGLKRQKNSAFWMKVNMTLKILAFCISSLQSSWHFGFWILWGTKHPIVCCVRIGISFAEIILVRETKAKLYIRKQYLWEKTDTTTE